MDAKTITKNAENILDCPGSISELVALGMKVSEIEIRSFEGSEKRLMAFIPDGMKPVCLDEFIPRRPDRKRVSVKMTNVESFISYVNEHKSSATRIFVLTQKTPYQFIAAIDYHEPGPDGKPEFITHKAYLDLVASEQWLTWTQSNGKSFEQLQFVDFLQDNRIDIIEPTGARIEEIALTLQLTTGGRCQNKVNLNNGSTHLEFKQDIHAQAGQDGSIVIPNQFKIAIPVFSGSGRNEIVADLRYRIANGKITFGYKLMQPNAIIQKICKEAVDGIQKKTELPVFCGSFE